jgi:DNA primase
MLKIEIARIKSDTDILAIVKPDTPLQKVSTTRGGEYAGPCPFCGGKDRLHVQPARGRWWCRQCSPDEHWEDVIAYVQKRDGVSFREAVERLSDGRLSPGFEPAQSSHQTPKPQSPDWSTIVGGLVNEFVDALWCGSPASRGALKWLHDRGLEDDTLKAWLIGFNPAARKVNGLWIEAGITIPYYAGAELYAINVRRPDVYVRKCPKADKYRMITGSQRVLFGADHAAAKPDVVIVEGEFDALLAWQAVSDYFDVFTMGGARSMPGSSWLTYLAWGERFYIATDNDEAGNEAAGRWMKLVGSRGIRAGVPAGKDLTEYWQKDGNIRQWLISLLPSEVLLPTICQ